MSGRRPVVLLEGRLGPLLPLLALGETCHAGSHASLGLGRYRLHRPRWRRRGRYGARRARWASAGPSACLS